MFKKDFLILWITASILLSVFIAIVYLMFDI